MLHTKRGWDNLPEVSQYMYNDTYFKKGESYAEWVTKITTKYQNDAEHGLRMANYFTNYWYHPSTPISSDSELPISCYVSHIPDSREGIFDGYHEGMWLGALGGGRGVYWGDVGGAGRPIGLDKDVLRHMSWSQVLSDKSVPKSSGTIPFLGPSDRLTYGISQAGVRRSTEAAYIMINHSDIEAFVDIRLETGDPNRRMPNLHHGIAITDEFMEAVKTLASWDLVCPHTKLVTKTVDAYDLWIGILECRKMETGEPFLLFIDTVNRLAPTEYKILDLVVYCSNICTEIVSHTSPDKTAVCNLGSINLEFWEEFKPVLDQFIADVSDFHDNVNNVFLAETAKFTGMKAEAFKRVRKAVIDERNIGIGAMGFHTLLQSKHLPFESPMAKGLNMQIFTAVNASAEKHQDSLPLSANCEMANTAGTKRRNIHVLAIAPTMSISNLCNLASSGIEPWVSNSFTKKLPQGSFIIRNKHLEQVIIDYADKHALNSGTYENWVTDCWKSIDKHGGSVQHLEWMDDYTKDVFKTAFEIDPRAILTLAADRQHQDGKSIICQSQSVNLFLPAVCSYEELHAVHYMAWELGLKSLYYLRSEPETTADTSNKERKPITLEDSACVSCE